MSRVQVIATAGHVDHGKSTLIHRLTGMQPDRWAEERRRGLTIDLGFAWTRLPSGQQVAFVDVPGHERFVGNMLAGVGPVPAVLFVVAADEGWQAQSEEHLTALDALGVEHGLVAVTRSDLADPEPARRQALQRMAATSLARRRTVRSVTVSGRTGEGIEALVDEITALTARLPAADPEADVRLWVDRAFTISGAGTVVTGTLRAGRLRIGDELQPCRADEDPTNTHHERARIRGLQALGTDRQEVTAPARVALNLRGVAHGDLQRGDALLGPDAWLHTAALDVRLRQLSRHSADGSGQPRGPDVTDRPRQSLMLHVGSAAVTVHLRPLDGDLARLRLSRALPLRIGDRGLLRDPGQHSVLAGVEVLDVRPPELHRRGAARARARELAGAVTDADDPTAEIDRAHLARILLGRHGLVAGADFRLSGLPATGRRLTADRGRTWYADEDHWQRLIRRATAELARWRADNPLAPGMPAKTLRQRLDIPSAVTDELLTAAGLSVRDGRVHDQTQHDQRAALPPAVDRAVAALEQDLTASPYVAPTADRLRELGLGTRELAAAVRAGRLIRIADGLVLLPGAETSAAERLATLPQPFTLSTARQALGTTRRVAVPLLELLADRGFTERLPDGTHRLRC